MTNYKVAKGASYRGISYHKSLRTARKAWQDLEHDAEDYDIYKQTKFGWEFVGSE